MRDNPILKSVHLELPKCTFGLRDYTGDFDLDSITKKHTSDAAVLEFDFIPNTDNIEFDYFFASEEYPEFINKGVNDVFAFFISGPGFNQKINMAILPDTKEPVTVDHVNAKKNSQFYRENHFWNTENAQFFKQNQSLGELSYSFQFDGMTTLLKAKANVIPYKTYHLKIAIADVGDNVYDSAVLLKYRSFKSNGERALLSEMMSKDFSEIFKETEYYKWQIVDTSIIVSTTIHFDFNSHIVKEEFFDELDVMVGFLERYFDIGLKLIGHTDDLGTDAYNLDLSYERARAIANYLISKGISPHRIQVEGRGKKEIIALEKTEASRALNRRVEFVFNDR
jgi:outer membrane protein OmpA-like peptidoglycan-associated protein